MHRLDMMYKDDYFPNYLVDKIKVEIEKVEEFLKAGNKDIKKIQVELDKMTEAINDIDEELNEAGSEIETMAREDIADSVYLLLKEYQIDIDIETAIRNRYW